MANTPSVVTTLSNAYALALWYSAGQDLRQVSLADFLTYLEANLDSTAKPEYVMQYSSPIAAGTVSVTAGDDNIWLILTPAGTLATLTITLPAIANLVDKQEIMVVSTQELTSLTVSKNDATDIKGEPTSLSAEGYFKMKYNSFYDTWYRVG